MDLEFKRILKRAIKAYQRQVDDDEKDVREMLETRYISVKNEKSFSAVASLQEIMINYFTNIGEVSLNKIPTSLRASINKRKYAGWLCKMLDPFIRASPKCNIYDSLKWIGDVYLERRHKTRLHIAGLELFGVKESFYDDEMIRELQEERTRTNIYAHIYYTYHLDEQPFDKDMCTPRLKRDQNFDIDTTDIGDIISLDPSMMKVIAKFEG